MTISEAPMNPRMILWLCVFFLVTLLTGCGGGDGLGSINDAPDDVDTDAPYVVSTNPVLNSTAVEINRAITVTFNEAIDPATITSNSFLIDNANGDIVEGIVAYDSASRTAIFRTGNLSPATNYVATITNAVEDLAGNTLEVDYTWQFTTAAPPEINAIDTTPPVVLNRFPAPNATSVASNTEVSVTFNEPMDPSTINTKTLTLNGTSSVSGTVSYVGTSALFKPTADLVAGTVYTVTVEGTVKDLAANPLGTPVVWNFTTGNQADVKSPQVLLVFPPDGADNVSINTSLKVDFDEAIIPFDLGTIDGKPVTVTFNESYTTAEMKPTAGLKAETPYRVGVRAMDQAGNLMDEFFIWQFTTAP